MPHPVFEITQDSLTSEPIKLVRFSHGRLKTEESDKLSWNVYRKKKAAAFKSKGPDRHILTASVNGMTYTGQDFGPQANAATDPCSYYIAMHNHATNKVRVLPAELYRLEPRVEEEQDELDNTDAAGSFVEKNVALAKEFGSGKSQRNVMKREQNKLDDDMVKSATKKIVDSSHTKEQTANTNQPTDVSEMSAIPPHNKDAQTPQEVYKLKDIIRDDLMPSLTAPCQLFSNCSQEDRQKWREEKTYTNFVLDKLETLSVRDDARLFQCQCLLYLSYLIKMFLLKYTDIRKKHPLPMEWPEPVKKFLLDKFTHDTKGPNGRNSRSLPGPLKDLLLSHILVLCLKLNNFQLDISKLIADLNSSQKKLTTHASALGCTVRSVKDKEDKSAPPRYVAELKVPLKFPESRGKSSKKRIF